MSVLDKILIESVFSSNPAKKRQAFARLHSLMKEPLHAHYAASKVQKHIDDPKLMADLHHFAHHYPEMDMRPLIKKRMKQASQGQ